MDFPDLQGHGEFGWQPNYLEPLDVHVVSHTPILMPELKSGR